MESIRRAVIDVGTNSIKLLVADVAGREVRPVWEESKQTRLGHGFYDTNRLQPEPIAKTAQAAAAFAAKARETRAVTTRIIATSAARDAVNAAELVSAIETASGLKVEIISGEQEADWAFQGVTTDPALAQLPLLLLDVGGGSSEFILGQGERKYFRESFRLGTVRLLEKKPHSDPPKPEELAACRQWVREFLKTVVAPKLGPLLPPRAARPPTAGAPPSEPGPQRGGEPSTKSVPVQLVGAGGTATLLGRMEARLDTYDRERLESTRLSLERLRWHIRRLWSLPLEERKQIVGLPKNRADVILTGVVIFEAIMDEFGFDELRLTTRGLRFAAVMGVQAGDAGSQAPSRRD
jgi:exopolyphosphatase/guanosine-5'-triphosphate,3'-diphosphate pyrophosphatase